MQKSTRRLQRQKLGRSAHWKVLLIIFLVVSVPTIGTILLVLLSSRPSLSDRTFPSSGDRQDADILDWPKLYSLNDRAPGADRLLQSVAGSDVRVPGYMLPFENPDREGKVSKFLLVPDPGNWFHPPHLDSGEVVYVRMSGGARTALVDRTPVWVRGRLSQKVVDKRAVERALELVASSVSELKELHE